MNKNIEPLVSAAHKPPPSEGSNVRHNTPPAVLLLPPLMSLPVDTL